MNEKRVGVMRIQRFADFGHKHLWTIIFLWLVCVIIYNVLAAGDFFSFWLVLIGGILAIGTLLLTCALIKQDPAFRWIFWILVLYFFSPIIMNALSMVFNFLGYTRPAEISFKLRFALLWFIPVVLLGIGGIAGFACDCKTVLVRWWKGVRQKI